MREQSLTSIRDRAEFEAFNVMGFCQAVEEFVDAKLSNWYIRRNRDRFWSNDSTLNDAGRKDKLAAYQTLRTVLTDLCRLCAPVVPFLTEVMWKNLASRSRERPVSAPVEKTPGTDVPGSPSGCESIHLANYPVADETLLASHLTEWTECLLAVVSLGSAARNAAKIKVRQPLAMLLVIPEQDQDALKFAIVRFMDQIREELNVKDVTLHDASNAVKVRMKAALNKMTASAKLGPKLKQAEVFLAGLDDQEARQLFRTTPPSVLGVELEEGDIRFTQEAPPGWVLAKNNKMTVLLSTQITPELKAEGLSRDVIRLVQDERKKAGLDVADKIELHLDAEGDLAAAISAHKDSIAADTQVVKWHESPFGDSHAASAKVDGQPLTINLKKA